MMYFKCDICGGEIFDRKQVDCPDLVIKKRSSKSANVYEKLDICEECEAVLNTIIREREYGEYEDDVVA